MDKKRVVCIECGKEFYIEKGSDGSYTPTKCPSCGLKVIDVQDRPLSVNPVAIVYSVHNGVEE